jgi:hypothetical protein
MLNRLWISSTDSDGFSGKFLALKSIEPMKGNIVHIYVKCGKKVKTSAIISLRQSSSEPLLRKILIALFAGLHVDVMQISMIGTVTSIVRNISPQIINPDLKRMNDTSIGTKS